MAKRKLEFIGGKSKKFWTIQLHGTSHTVTYGRLGATGRTVTKDFDTKQKAKTSHDKLVQQKLDKGYVDVKKAVPAHKNAMKKAAPTKKTKKAPNKASRPTCTSCGQQFTPSPEARDVIKRYKARGATLLFVCCTKCGFQIDYNPQTGGIASRKKDTLYRCPVSRCTGSVSHVEYDDGPFWGCGGCGAIWYEKDNLLKEIDDIVKRFKYRRKCYKKTQGKWVPADLGKEPSDYNETVEQEPDDQLGEHVRG